MNPIEIIKLWWDGGPSSVNDYNFDLIPQKWKGYDVVFVLPKGVPEFAKIGLPVYVLVKDGECRYAEGDEIFEILGWENELPTLKEYTATVKNHLIKVMGMSPKVAKSILKGAKEVLEECWRDNLPANAAAAGLWHNYL